MSEVEWRGRSVPVKIDKARIFLLGLADNEAAIAQVSVSIVGGKNLAFTLKPVLLAVLYGFTCKLYEIIIHFIYKALYIWKQNLVPQEGLKNILEKN